MLTGTAVYGTVRTVVWEDGGSNPASYPIVPANSFSSEVSVWKLLLLELVTQLCFK
jgi:hypothetical protein